MKKKLWLLLLVSFMAWNVYPYVDHAEGTTTVSTDQNNDSSKLTKQIESIQADLKDLKEDKKLSTDTISKEDLYNALLDREKDVSSSLYNFTMFFVSFVALAVAIGVIYFGKLARDLKEHQKKVDLVMDSKEFDEKINYMYKKISDLEAKDKYLTKKSREKNITSWMKAIEQAVEEIESFPSKTEFHSSKEIKEITYLEGFTWWEDEYSPLEKELKSLFQDEKELEEKGLKPGDDPFEDILARYKILEARLEPLLSEVERIRRKMHNFVFNIKN